jgi:molybdopterin synthase sulfur carrier subunit
MIQIKLLSFGIVGELLGNSEREMQLNKAISVAQFKTKLLEENPQLVAFQNFTIARNEVYAEKEELIENGDIIALIPPVAGG